MGSVGWFPSAEINQPTINAEQLKMADKIFYLLAMRPRSVLEVSDKVERKVHSGISSEELCFVIGEVYIAIKSFWRLNCAPSFGLWMLSGSIHRIMLGISACGYVSLYIIFGLFSLYLFSSMHTRATRQRRGESSTQIIEARVHFAEDDESEFH